MAQSPAGRTTSPVTPFDDPPQDATWFVVDSAPVDTVAFVRSKISKGSIPKAAMNTYCRRSAISLGFVCT